MFPFWSLILLFAILCVVITPRNAKDAEVLYYDMDESEIPTYTNTPASESISPEPENIEMDTSAEDIAQSIYDEL